MRRNFALAVLVISSGMLIGYSLNAGAKPQSPMKSGDFEPNIQPDSVPRVSRAAQSTEIGRFDTTGKGDHLTMLDTATGKLYLMTKSFRWKMVANTPSEPATLGAEVARPVNKRFKLLHDAGEPAMIDTVSGALYAIEKADEGKGWEIAVDGPAK